MTESWTDLIVPLLCMGVAWIGAGACAIWMIVDYNREKRLCDEELRKHDEFIRKHYGKESGAYSPSYPSCSAFKPMK